MFSVANVATDLLGQVANEAVIKLISPQSYEGFELFHDSVKQAFYANRYALGARSGRMPNISRRHGVTFGDTVFNECMIIDLFGSLVFGKNYIETISNRPREQRQAVGALFATLAVNNLQCSEQSIEVECHLMVLKKEYDLSPIRHVQGDLVWLYVNTSGYCTRRRFVRSNIVLTDLDSTKVGAFKGIDAFKLATYIGGFVKVRNTTPFIAALHHNIANLTEYFTTKDLPLLYTTSFHIDLRTLCTLFFDLVVDNEMAKGSNVDIIFFIESSGLFAAYVRDVALWGMLGSMYRPLPSKCAAYEANWPWLPMFWDILALPEDVVETSDILTVYALCTSATVIEHGTINSGYGSQMGIVSLQ